MRSGLIVAAMLAATAASAQPYKCTNEEGKTVYSDQRCDATPKKAPAAAAPEAKKDGRYSPTAEEAARLKTLEHEAGKHDVTSERKTALLLEASAIRSGVDARLSAEDRSKRDILYAELTSKNASTRTRALADVRALYGKQ